MSEIGMAIKKNKTLGYRVVDHLPNGSVRAIKDIQKKKGIDEIIVCEPYLTDEEIAKIIDYCQIHNIVYKFVPTTLQTTRFKVQLFNSEPIIEVLNTPLDGWGKILKRLFDIIGSGILLVVLSPVLLFTALAIKLTSNGPVIYKNERIGEEGKTFFVFKFRYLKWEYCITSENKHNKKAIELEKKLIKKYNTRKGALYKIKDDPRKTTVGKFIEKYSIDELPQLWNVLKGDMSLVGPRPHQEREVNKYREYHRRLLTIKPGITGMAQISGRSDLDFEDEYKLDVFYIENWSLLLDIIILLKTPFAVFNRRKNTK
jgi:exopolysaccharide biosynthesis polyprenyl glycosylphosphotransferase